MKKHLKNLHYRTRSHSEISLTRLIKSELYDEYGKYAIMLIAGDKHCGKSLLSMKVITQLCSEKHGLNNRNKIKTYIPLWFDIDTRLFTSKKHVSVYDIQQQITKQLPQHIDDPVHNMSLMKYLHHKRPNQYLRGEYQVVIYLNVINDLADNVDISIENLIWFVRCNLCSHYSSNYVVILEFNASVNYPPKQNALSFDYHYDDLSHEYGITSTRFACVKICNYACENVHLFEKIFYKIFDRDLYLDTNDDKYDSVQKSRQISIPLDVIREIQKYLKSVFGYWDAEKASASYLDISIFN